MEVKLEVLNKIVPNTCVKVRDKEHLEQIKLMMKRDGYRFFGGSEKECLRNEVYLNFYYDFDVASSNYHDKGFKLVEYELETPIAVLDLSKPIAEQLAGKKVKIESEEHLDYVIKLSGARFSCVDSVKSEIENNLYVEFGDDFSEKYEYAVYYDYGNLEESTKKVPEIKIPLPTIESRILAEKVGAIDILNAAKSHLDERAKIYDRPEGERSIGSVVKAFNALTVDGLMNTEERGWMFMVLLKLSRSQQGSFKLDNYEDGTNYFALMGEAAYRSDQAASDTTAKN